MSFFGHEIKILFLIISEVWLNDQLNKGCWYSCLLVLFLAKTQLFLIFMFLLPIVFTVILGIVGVLTWEAWYSVFVFVGLVINTLCMSFSDPQKVRASILVTSPMVIVYDVFALSIGGIVYESVVIVSSLVGLLRFHKGKCSKNGKTV